MRTTDMTCRRILIDRCVADQRMFCLGLVFFSWVCLLHPPFGTDGGLIVFIHMLGMLQRPAEQAVPNNIPLGLLPLLVSLFHLVASLKTKSQS